MHVYTLWLPPPVAEEAKTEAAAFKSVVRSVKSCWRTDDPDSIHDTLKWISVIDIFVEAKSNICQEDVKELIEFGLELLCSSQDMNIQVRWAYILNRLLRKHRKNLSLTIDWRPFYDILLCMHFKRNTGPEGWRLKREHLRSIRNLIQHCRRFFPAGSSSQIWSEFSGFLINPWSHSAFKGCGFLNLFLSMNLENRCFFNSEWIEKCLEIWESVPNCQFWNHQWVSIFARCTKHCTSINWEDFHSRLFTLYLNMFEISPSYRLQSEQYLLSRPHNLSQLFCCYNCTPTKAIAKSIVYLLKPSSSAHQYFQMLVEKLEQYFHPSNEGDWTDSLDSFLWYLVTFFKKRLSCEISYINKRKYDIHLGRSERERFVKTVLRLMEKGQYSKNEDLTNTVTEAVSILSYVEPSWILPFISSRFHLAHETTTAIHQLTIALSSVAAAGRAFLLYSSPTNSTDFKEFNNLMKRFLSVALVALDANDPPKTRCAMKLICSVFSNIPTLVNEVMLCERLCVSDWLQEFLSRLFCLLRNMDSDNIVHDGLRVPTAKPTFLCEGSSCYYLMLQILLSRLSQPLFKQAMESISQFVNENFLPGVRIEIGLLCSACVEAEPELAGHHLVSKILITTLSLLKRIPSGSLGENSKDKISLSLEMVTVYHLNILAIAIYCAGPVLAQYKDVLKETISLAFENPSWKVNESGGFLLQSLLHSLVFYYPIDQYRSIPGLTCASMLDPWLSAKVDQIDECDHETLSFIPKWHIPSKDESSFANELLEMHIQLASDELTKCCQVHQDKSLLTEGDSGSENRLKVSLLRIKCSLEGVLSCLPEMQPTYKDSELKSTKFSNYVLISGSNGTTVGSSEMRERVAKLIHSTCQYLLAEKADESIVLELAISIIDLLGNYGSTSYDRWQGRNRDLLDSNFLVEPSFNFISSCHTDGKKRPRWALIEKAHMHNTYRASQSFYHEFQVDENLSPSKHMICLMQDLLDLSLHNYDGIRYLARRSLLRMFKRCPSLISKFVIVLVHKLCDQKTPEHVVLGSCKLLSDATVIRHLHKDTVSFSSFILGILESFYHESLKSQKAITELFLEFNKNYAGIPVEFSKVLDGRPTLLELISKIRILNFSSTTLRWRYSLMADRIILLLTLSCTNDSMLPFKIRSEITGHFLKNLQSQLPQSRMLSISALNCLLQGTQNGAINASTRETLTQLLLQDGFLTEIFTELSLLHDNAESDNLTNKALFFNLSMTDDEITLFYFDFCASWPRTRDWIYLDSFPGSVSFNSRFARVFKRLVQECGSPALGLIQSAIEQISDSDDRSKRAIASEALAGLLHSNTLQISDEWVSARLENILAEASFESVENWAACIQYAVTEKGIRGSEAPVLRQIILDSLAMHSSKSKAALVAKRYYFLSVALNEVSPAIMSNDEVRIHHKIFEELLGDLDHFSPQVREVVGATLCIVCSNMRFYTKSLKTYQEDNSIQSENMLSFLDSIQNLTNKKDDTGTDLTETMIHFMMSCLVSGRSTLLLDMIVRIINPVLSLQDTPNKDLSKLARDAFELLSWRIFPRPFLESAMEAILSSATDSNWRTRCASLTCLEAFMYRHTFILSNMEKSQIWESIKKLLSDTQVEVREHAAKVLASLMIGGEEDFSSAFRKESFANAEYLFKGNRQKYQYSSCGLASTHGVVLALAASVLSAPYDMPSWLPNHVTLLAKFISEPYPIRSTVTKTVAEFKRSHADTWDIQKNAFTEEQLEVLADTSLSTSYFA
ncbi:Proteasome activator complex subunit 4 [Rhynchospora pubera]|uniref:Proteasome activator complex subunit 4 n=1 Tax=Rhynchospora pubera TaxID=906938 RepID=A0AAV8H5R4_9POAL|nr:Proteasome activator complex subunit 4 [Rhynchospora pubera]